MIIALVNQKGGVSKTTLTTCLAIEAASRGQETVLIDADPQWTAMIWAQVRRRSLEAEGRAEPFNLSLRPALDPGAIRDQVSTVAAAADLVLIDCPPRHSEMQAAALLHADLALIPCGPTGPDAWALGDTLDLLKESQKERPVRACMVLTRTRTLGTAAASARASLAEESGLLILSTEIGDRIAYQDAITAGDGVTSYAPRSVAAAEIRALYDELLALLLELP